MMISNQTLQIFVFSLSLLVSAADCWAQKYEDDLMYFRRAIHFSRFSENELNEFLNPLHGQTEFRLSEDRVPWAGNFFPMSEGGIANRWQRRRGSKPADATTLTPERVRSMSAKSRASLSAVEKLDLLAGDYDLPTTRFELEERGPLRDPAPERWEGFCNGVRCAGILMPEPRYPVVLANPDGIPIHFEPADLKALAGAAYFYVQRYAQLGAPTRERRRTHPVNPAVLDLVLRYFLAEKRKSFVVDSNIGYEIWNESIVGYERTLSEPKRLTPTEKSHYPWAVDKIEVTGYVESLGETSIKESNRKTTHLVANGKLLGSIPVAYTLYRDQYGNARDGKWKGQRGLRGIDFAWFAGGRGADAEYAHEGGNPYINFDLIRKLVHKSAQFTCDMVLNSL